jgi:hypothetical protein
MREDTGIIKAGMAIIISSGCYSDYSFGQVYIALKDFNYMEQAKKCFFDYANENKEEALEDGYVYTSNIDFEDWLIKNGFLGLCDNREIHVGDYDFFDEKEWFEEWKKECRL